MPGFFCLIITSPHLGSTAVALVLDDRINNIVWSPFSQSLLAASRIRTTRPFPGRGGLRRLKQPPAGVEATAKKSLTVPAIRRLARRAGVKRVSKLIYFDARQSLTQYLRGLIKDAAVYAEHSRRHTLTCMDVLRALKRRGQSLYGYGDYLPEQLERRAARLREPLPLAALQAARSMQAATPDSVSLGDEDARGAVEDNAYTEEMPQSRQLEVQRAISECMADVSRGGENRCSFTSLYSNVNRRLSFTKAEECSTSDLRFLVQALHNAEHIMFVQDDIYLI